MGQQWAGSCDPRRAIRFRDRDAAMTAVCRTVKYDTKISQFTMFYARGGRSEHVENKSDLYLDVSRGPNGVYSIGSMAKDYRYHLQPRMSAGIARH
ncbi:hypothetical protein NDU88_004904 [Pleurodeles waltl]|uniref:Uncharacterized protein n=1 Tax=Pleurodeles waltl TaxID=8319 RepID=A0AAV7NTT2_PLEWA|nr:hypothetical protein NDU88_004904 [Pleurodeles waltl]